MPSSEHCSLLNDHSGVDGALALSTLDFLYFFQKT